MSQRLDCAGCGVNPCKIGGQNQSFNGGHMNNSEEIPLYEETEELCKIYL